MPENALTGGKEDIGRDEPSYLRIVVTGPEVVEARLFVRQSSDCRYTHIHDNGRDYSFRVWTRVSLRLTEVFPNCQTSTAAKSLLR